MLSKNPTRWTGLIGFIERTQRAKAALKPLPISPRSILFIELTRLGDVVSLVPLLHSARIAWPTTHITVAVQTDYAGFFKYLPFVDTVIPLGLTRSLAGLFQARSMLRKRRYDMAISASPGRRNALLTLGARAQMKTGYFTTPATTATFLDSSPVSGIGVRIKSVPAYHREPLHERTKRIATALAIPFIDNITWEIPLPVQEALRTQMLRGSVSSGTRIVVLHPYAGWQFREWDLQNYLMLAADLSEAHTVVIAGTKEELGRSPMLQQLPRGVMTYEITALEDYFALLAQARLFIGSDSGPLHAAASLGIPHIGLFGPAPPQLTGPASDRGTLLYRPMECSPCEQSLCIHPERPCMTFIQVSEVLQAANVMLQREQTV